MDKREFYKEIMSQYTFDEEKIRRNAKRRSSVSFLDRHGKWLPLSAAAAVFVSVFGSYMMFSSSFYQPPSVVPENAAFSAGGENQTVSASRRLAEMERLILLYGNDKLGSETKVMYVTFRQPITLSEFDYIITSAVSDTGIIKIESLYNDGFVLSKDADSDTLYTAAKIHAPVYLYGKLLEVETFEFIDLDDVVNDENFEPFKTEKSITYAEKTEPVTENASTTGITETTERIDTPISTITNPAATDAPTTNTATDAPVTEAPTDTTQSTSPSVSDETAELSDEVLNPIEEAAVLKIPAENVLDVKFINDDYFILLFKNKASLNRIIKDDSLDMIYFEQISSFDVNDPQITYTCAESKTFVILGNDTDNRRARLLIANGIYNTLNETDISLIPQDANITYAFCNGERILLKAQSPEASSLYAGNKDGSEKFRLDKLYDIPQQAQTRVVNFDDTSFVYVVTYKNEDGAEINEIYDYSYSDFTSYQIDAGIDLTGSFSFVRSPDLSNFAINNTVTGEAWVWNSIFGELSSKLDTNITKFSDFNNGIFTDGMNWYRLEGLEIEAISEAEASSLSVKPDFSSKYTIFEVTSDMVKIEVK